MNSFINNVRYGLRLLPRAPGFALTVILTMALDVRDDVIGLMAAWIPARRALAVEPWMVLREE